VTTVITINHGCSHCFLSTSCVSELTHASPLPGVFFSICEENVVALNIKSTIVVVGPGIIVWREILAEYSGAVVWPKANIKNLRAHGLSLIPRSLEKSELCAVLVSPLTKVFVYVDCLILKCDSIILIIVESFAVAIVGNPLQLSKDVIVFLTYQHIAQSGTIPILHTSRVDVRQVPEEVKFVKCVWLDVEYCANFFYILVNKELGFNPRIMLDYLIRAINT
jgi:hypothetical protein